MKETFAIRQPAKSLVSVCVCVCVCVCLCVCACVRVCVYFRERVQPMHTEPKEGDKVARKQPLEPYPATTDEEKTPTSESPTLARRREQATPQESRPKASMPNKSRHFVVLSSEGLEACGQLSASLARVKLTNNLFIDNLEHSVLEFLVF